jgi:3-oxoacyl-[acyl-carrier-protein] synthase-3
LPLHVKRPLQRALIAALGVAESRTVYLGDTGHMSGIDSLFAMDRAARTGMLSAGDLGLLNAAGTGYTWAATAVE